MRAIGVGRRSPPVGGRRSRSKRGACESGGQEGSCDYRVRIPMPGGAESLNAGVAAGIVLYEAARRRG
ncbi:TrmH family RNA methyltransferase [Streptomyces sp. CA-249302]|uniref:TrmH family RNA methyltransferase n=1 Tax=Streptomyces sp. CA-249302 TaxID=3240058 RepID=UPI003D8CFAFC